MQYKLKNISSGTFSFEGVTILAGEVSKELLPDVYQRLLAVYYGATLMPIDDPSYMTVPPVEEKVEEKDEKEDKKDEEKDKKDEDPEKDEEKEKLPQFICDVCKKEFKSNRALLAHKRFAHKKVETK